MYNHIAGFEVDAVELAPVKGWAEFGATSELVNARIMAESCNSLASFMSAPCSKLACSRFAELIAATS
jgi:hypothetical protein